MNIIRSLILVLSLKRDPVLMRSPWRQSLFPFLVKPTSEAEKHSKLAIFRFRYLKIANSSLEALLVINRAVA